MLKMTELGVGSDLATFRAFFASGKRSTKSMSATSNNLNTPDLRRIAVTRQGSVQNLVKSLAAAVLA